jgi:hypothetical protein
LFLPMKYPGPWFRVGAWGVALAACGYPQLPALGGGDASGGGDGDAGNPASDPPGHVASSKTWSGTVDVSETTTIDTGVTLTVAPGTTVRFAEGKSLVINGILDVRGEKAAVVNLSPAIAGGHHDGISVAGSGQLKMTYGVQVGGGILVNGGKITVSDSLMSQASSDFLTINNSATVTISYSQFGLGTGTGTDTTHTDVYIGSPGSTISITHTNISTAPYGVMLYGGTGVDLTHNNWFSNGKDIDTQAGVMGDVSFGWFAQGAPMASPGATLVYANASTARLSDAGPR